MTLTKYQSTPALEARFNRNLGRSTKDPNVRLPIQNPVHEAVLQAQGRTAPNRANALLNARGGIAAPSRSRSWVPFTPLFGAAGWPDDASAASWETNAHDFLILFEAIDWSHPGFMLGLGSAILATQVVAMVQRHAMLRRSRPAKVITPQPDLFPETLPVQKQVRSPWQVDAATRQGKVRTENQDAIATLEFGDGSRILIVCDGAGGVAGGKEASEVAVVAIKEHLTAVFGENASLVPVDLETAIEAARDVAAQKKLTGLTTALLVLLQNDQVHWATLGDGDVAVIWPDGMVSHLQVPHHTAGQPSNIINAYIGNDCRVQPRTGSLRVEAGAMVLAMSDGASDLFPYDDVALNRDGITTIEGLANSFLKNLEDARDPDTAAYLHNDNMSLAMARLVKGGDHAE